MTRRHRPSRAPELLLVGLLPLVVIAACGGSEASGTTSSEVTVTYRASDDAELKTVHLTCGDEAGCAELEAVDASVWNPPAQQMCTQIYGGPEVVTVRGTVNGKAVDATVKRTDGCEVKRFNALKPLLAAANLT